MSSAAVTQTVFSPSVIVLNFNLSWTRSVWFVVNSSFSGNCKTIERGSYVTAGYGRHRGECGLLLLLLPTLLFHLIIWPPCWLKACCMVTWWLSHPHCCQMKALSRVIKLGKPLRNKKKKKNQPNFNQIAYNSNLHFAARFWHFKGQNETDAICETQMWTTVFPSHVHQEIMLTSSLKEIWKKGCSMVNQT